MKKYKHFSIYSGEKSNVNSPTNLFNPSANHEAICDGAFPHSADAHDDNLDAPRHLKRSSFLLLVICLLGSLTKI